MKYNEEHTAYYEHMQCDDWSLYIAATDKGLCFIGSQNEHTDELKQWFKKNRPNTRLVEDWGRIAVYADQLAEYLNGERKTFDLPVDLVGTEFQHAVWTELRNIPFGEKKTYSDIAENIGRPKAVRAVGSAIGANPVLMVVPCHRVIAKSGKLGGFRGGISMKKGLLELEGNE